MSLLPRYPVYIPSKGRWNLKRTAYFLKKDQVPFWLVVEESEAEEYRLHWGPGPVLVMDTHGDGSSVPARNWIKRHATAYGHARHWMLDDNMHYFLGWRGGKRLPCQAGPAMRAMEDFCDRYENIAVAGPNYYMFGHVDPAHPPAPFRTNCHVYSCMLLDSTLPFDWRGRYNEDTDYCLQALAKGYCTVQFQAFLIWKDRTMKTSGGNTDRLYQGDGRLKMARSLERMWPGVVSVDRRFSRPQHVVNWRKFDTKLKLRAGVDLTQIPDNNYGLVLQATGAIQSERLQAIYLAEREKIK